MHSANGQVNIAQGSIRKQIDLIFCQFSIAAQFSDKIMTNELKSEANPLGNKWNHFTIYCSYDGSIRTPPCWAISHIFSSDDDNPTTDRDQWISFSNISFSWFVGCVVAIPRLISLKFDSGRFYWIVRFNQFISYFHFQFRAKCVVQKFARSRLASMWCQPVNACCSFCSSNVLWFSENIIAPFKASAYGYSHRVWSRIGRSGAFAPLLIIIIGMESIFICLWTSARTGMGITSDHLMRFNVITFPPNAAHRITVLARDTPETRKQSQFE